MGRAFNWNCSIQWSRLSKIRVNTTPIRATLLYLAICIYHIPTHRGRGARHTHFGAMVARRKFWYRYLWWVESQCWWRLILWTMVLRERKHWKHRVVGGFRVSWWGDGGWIDFNLLNQERCWCYGVCFNLPQDLVPHVPLSHYYARLAIRLASQRLRMVVGSF